MSVAYVSSTTFAEGSGTSISAHAKPASTAIGDVLIAQCSIENDVATLTIASTGDTWTLVPATGPAVNTTPAPDLQQWVWICVVANTSSTIDVTWGGGAFWRDFAVHRFTGVDNTTPQDVTATKNTGTSTTPLGTGLASGTANRHLVLCSASLNGQTHASWTSPLTERADSGNVAMASGDDAAGTDTANKTATITSDSWTTVMLALRSAGAAADSAGPITYKSQGAGASTESSGAALSPACPATVDVGDILIGHVFWEGTTSTPDTPAGWTLLDGPQVIESTIARQWVFGKIADGTEDGAAVAFGNPAVTTQRAARIYSFAGRVAGTITELVRGFAFLSHATDPQMPTVSTTQTGALAVAVVGQNDNNAMGDPTGETGGDWVEAVAEYTVGLTPGFTIAVETCTPTANPGTVTGGAIATTNDPVGVTGFEIRHTFRTELIGGPYGLRGQSQMRQLLAT
jgi:hypothetical protein